ncbi:glycosyltransferase family 4 protein [Paenibacillus guangzhouensis]|uniref:glycosyltransferase family 4 protein n=1 Tax=Paenibacillus guangzhouensis TaxID=1473112 RepID=UPI00187B29F0|nr:glycosyltransferase family 4 protein [Paenibacillus guangzhouensis]
MSLEINQLVLYMSYGDAISNSAINMKKMLHSKGIKSEIYAQAVDPNLGEQVRPLHEAPLGEPVIYHMGIGCDLAQLLTQFTSKRILLYHNITPSHFFTGYDPFAESLCARGRQELAFLRPYVDIAFADSEFNRQELIQYGYNRTAVTPIIMNFEDYHLPPNPAMMHHLSATKRDKDLLFVGRVVPNKKQQDIIRIFYYYKNYFAPDARLFLVGRGDPLYLKETQQLVASLNLEDVHITGHIHYDQLLAYYRNADLFLCMSEHEGFGVPLLEAMQFQLPIIAYDAAAVGETVGDGGILVQQKDYFGIAALVNQVLGDEGLKQNMLHHQKARLHYYSSYHTTQMFWDQIKTEFSIP